MSDGKWETKYIGEEKEPIKTPLKENWEITLPKGSYKITHKDGKLLFIKLD